MACYAAVGEQNLLQMGKGCWIILGPGKTQVVRAEELEEESLKKFTGVWARLRGPIREDEVPSQEQQEGTVVTRAWWP